MRSKSSASYACSVVILIRFFTSFVSFSVFCLLFSLSCCPSVDSGRMASLLGLGLIIFLGNWVQEGWKVFWTELTELKKWESAASSALGMRQFCGALAMHCNSSSSSRCTVDILLRFFTSFVSCSVFRLSFSSFCCPSVDSGRMASLPSLGLIVFLGNWVQGD